jgi:hypothetical protein
MHRFPGGRLVSQLSNELHSAMQALSVREGISVFMCPTAELQTLLFMYTSQEDGWMR